VLKKTTGSARIVGCKKLNGKIDGANWHEYCPRSVVHWFSDKTLSILFKYYGFELIAKGYPPKKINADHAFSFWKEGALSQFLRG
jgi:hypothetical protein